MNHDASRYPYNMFFQRLTVRVAIAIVLVAAGVALGIWLRQPRLTEEEIRNVLITTIQNEAPASFYITGSLDIAATTTVENTKYLFPDIMMFDLGTTRATVRMPGRISYGFDVTNLHPEDIRVLRGNDGLIEVALPSLSIYSVEPDLEKMEVETSIGWARLYTRSGRRVEQEAIRFVQQALREQGERYLDTSVQARSYTKEAMQKLLSPILEAAGLSDPQFRILIGDEVPPEPGEVF